MDITHNDDGAKQLYGGEIIQYRSVIFIRRGQADRSWARPYPKLNRSNHRSRLRSRSLNFWGRRGRSQTIDYRKFPNKGLQWFYWNARGSLNFAIGRFIVGAGYYISNLDYYSGRRNVTLANGQKFYVPKREISQSIFLSIGYSF